MTLSPPPPAPNAAPAPSASPAPAEAAPAVSPWLAPLLIAAATLLAYSNSFRASFHLDDLGVILQDERLRDLRRLWPPAGNRWVGDLTFALNFRLGGAGVVGFHVVNVLIHVGNALLVHRLAAMALRSPALREARVGPLVRAWLPLTAGLLFALHPLATQAVTYVVQRYASLATLLYLASLALYAAARGELLADRPSKGRAALLGALSILSAALAMKTKEISFTLPFVALGMELLLFRPGRRLLLLVPLAATALLPLVDPALGKSLADAGEMTQGVYLLTQARVVVTYLRLLLLPVGQNFDYDYPLSHSLAEPAVLLSLAVLAAVVAAAAALLVRSRRAGSATGILVAAGVAWFFVTVSVESSLVPIRDVIFEHRVYLPSVGAAIAFAAALLWGVERLRLGIPLGIQCAAALLLTAVPLGAATWARNQVWRDELSLWSDVVAKSPAKARPHNHLGLAYYDRGEIDKATREFLLALRIRPLYFEAILNLGNCFWNRGLFEDAQQAYSMAVQLQPDHAMAHNNLGASFQQAGQFDRAEREFREALRLSPGLPAAQKNLDLNEARRDPTGPAAKRLRFQQFLEKAEIQQRSNHGGARGPHAPLSP